MVLIAVMVNFAAMCWFAQYFTTGWILYVYVVGSFAVLCLAMVFTE